jgi:hypothetical protein
MSVAKLLGLPFRYRPWRPRHLRLIAADLGRPAAQPAQAHDVHLAATIDWLCRAQDVRDAQSDAGGVSAGWSFEDGWLPSYPETTGYIVETFLAAAKILERPELVDRAHRMIDWELSLQAPDGAFPGHFGEPGSHPVIFNQGQIMHGLVAGYVQLGRQDCLEALVRAGHWLVAQQDADGCWRKFEHNRTPHVYNTRGTWALLSAGLVADDAALVDAARRNLDWALTQQTESGWYATNAFVPTRSPFTHTIAYAIRGFLESGVLLGEERYVESALRAGRAMAQVQREDGWLAGTYRDGWVADARYACLTGIAQMSLNWTRMAQVTGDDSFRRPARATLAYLKTTQRLNDPDDAVRGGIAGSSPIWGDYSRFEYPNWAAKFFADALMMDMADIAVPPAVSARPGRSGFSRDGAVTAATTVGIAPEGAPTSSGADPGRSGIHAAISPLRVMVLCGRSPRHLYVANTLCRAADVVAIVQEKGSELSWKKLAKTLRPDNCARKAWRWVRDRRRYTGNCEARFFFGDEVPKLDRPDLVREIPHINHPDVVGLARELEPDILAVFGTSLIRGDLLREGRLGIVNLHGGLSPEYRGADCTFWALYNREPEKVGCTLHWIDAGIDTGRLIAHISPAIEPDDDELSLFWRAVRTSADVYADFLRRAAAGERFGQSQPGKGRLYQVRHRGLRHERAVDRHLASGLLRTARLGARIRWFPITGSEA